MDGKIFSAENVKITLKNDAEYPLVNGVNIEVNKGGCTGIIGESGSGKSLCCKTFLGLLDEKKWLIEGEVYLENQSLPYKNNKQMRCFRGEKMSIIFQNPLSAFDQRITVGKHFLEAAPRKEREKAKKHALDLLSKMNIKDPVRVFNDYPFQLSGGMLQRVLIAISLFHNPQFLIADEPTTALDRLTEEEIIELLGRLQQEENLSILLVSHDLDVIAKLADTIYIMYDGEILEYGTKDNILTASNHPYTTSLLLAKPSFSKDKLKTLVGKYQTRKSYQGQGCIFSEECEFSQEICRTQRPDFKAISNKHYCKCHFKTDRMGE